MLHSCKMKELTDAISSYKIAIFASFGLFIFTYLFYCLNFTFGNHSWIFVIYGVPWNCMTDSGRPFAQLPLALLEGGVFLPLLGPMLSLCAWFASGVLFLLLFRIPTTGKATFFFAASLLALSPILIGRIYYEAADLAVTCGMFFFSLGAWLSARGTGKTSFFAAVLLFFYTFGSHPCFLNTAWVVLLWLLILNSIYHLENKIHRYAGALCISLPMYYIFVKLILHIPTAYNNHFGSLSNIFSAFAAHLELSALYPFLTQPPMGLGYKSLYALFFFSCLLILFKKSIQRPLASLRSGQAVLAWLRPGGRPFTVLLIAFLYLFHNPSGYLSAAPIAFTTQMRMDFFSVPLITGICALIFIDRITRTGLGKKIGYSLATVFILLSVCADLRATQVWWITLQDDILYSNRLLMRIEAQPGFDASKRWQYLQLGDRPVFGTRFFRNFKLRTLELQRPMNLSRNQEWVFHYIAPNLQIVYPSMKRDDICKKYGHFLANTEPYPKQSSILVDDGLIIVTLDQQTARAYCPSEVKQEK